ncbi:O-antigen ligase family protein [Desulfonema ishimotonii]|uniref:O-antigen ligase family protein n=1 Tax=Desulfonema ishimotonii TaxID=45657 RepID=UPI000F563B81|nr:O-antigen ligase family protein [Desulfonema ishimotonii]
MKKLADRSSLFFISYLFSGLASGYLLTQYSWQLSILFISVLGATVIAFCKPEYMLYLFFFAIIIMTEALPEGKGPLVIRDIDLPGFPPGTISVLLFVFIIYFSKIYFIKKEKSVVSIRYMLLFFGLLFLAVITGLYSGWEPFYIRLDLTHIVLPVLCFYLCINILNDTMKIYRMIRVIFIACFIKSVILDSYYLMDRGFPFGDTKIVTTSSGELMAFSIIILITCTLLTFRRISGIGIVFPVLSSVPMAFAIIFSFRRGHWLGLIASIIFLLMRSPRQQRKKLMRYLFVTVCLTVTFSCLLVNTVFLGNKTDISRISTRFSSIFDPEQHSNQHHYLESVQTVKDILKNPLPGLGLGSRHSPVSEELLGWSEDEQPTDVVHNGFIYLWMKTGLPGLLYFLWFGGKYLRQLTVYIKTYSQSRILPLVLGIGSSIGVWIVMFMTGPVPWYYHQTCLIALFSAMVITLIRLDTKGNKL